MNDEIKLQCNCQICQYFRLFKKTMDEIETIGNINAEYFDDAIAEIYNAIDDNLDRFQTDHDAIIAMRK